MSAWQDKTPQKELCLGVSYCGFAIFIGFDTMFVIFLPELYILFASYCDISSGLVFIGNSGKFTRKRTAIR